MNDRYYVCEQCGHYWLAPEWPDKCENCSEHGMNLVPASTMDKAEDISQEVLDGVR